MEAYVSPVTGLLPHNLAMVRLVELEDGRKQALFEFDAGAPRSLRFAPGEAAAVEHSLAASLEQEIGFSRYAAQETARRLFEPFHLAGEWSW